MFFLCREGCKDDAEEDCPKAEELRGTEALLVDEVAPSTTMIGPSELRSETAQVGPTSRAAANTKKATVSPRQRAPPG